MPLSDRALPLLLACVALVAGTCGQRLSQNDADIAGVQLFGLPSATDSLQGGCAFNGTTVYFGGGNGVLVVDMQGNSASVVDHMDLPSQVVAVSDLQGPAPLAAPVSFNGSRTVSFCSQSGSFGGGLVRVNIEPPHHVSWLNESQWVYFQACAGDQATGIVYLVDGGSGAGFGMNVRMALPGASSLSFELQLPVHTFLPTGDSVSVQSVVDAERGLLFVSGVYPVDTSAASKPWQWGISVVNLTLLTVEHTIPVASLAHTSTTVNSIVGLFTGRNYLYVIIAACPASHPAGIHCQGQADDDLTIMAYPLDALGRQSNDPDLGPRRGASARGNASVIAPVVSQVGCPSAIPDLLALFDDADRYLYLRCSDSYALTRVSLPDLTVDGSTCDSIMPDGFGVVYASIMSAAGTAYMGVASDSGEFYVASVQPAAMSYESSCDRFYQHWWFYVAVIGGAVVLTLIIMCVWSVCHKRSANKRQRRPPPFSQRSSGSGLYRPPHVPSPSRRR